MNANTGPKELDGLAAIVTGSAQNIGRAIALALADAGAAVVINARTSVKAAEAVVGEIEAAGGRAIVQLGDVTDPDAVEDLIAAAVDAFGRLDILVNNVATRSHTPITETSYEDWRAVLSSTVDAAFLTIKASVPHLEKGGNGTIVNIGGVSGHAGVANRAAVAAGKAGLAGMSGSLAVELAPKAITVNCVSPGLIETDRGGASTPIHFVERAVPLGRPGSVHEIAGTVRFLAGPSGRYITGQTIHVNGAWYVTIA